LSDPEKIGSIISRGRVPGPKKGRHSLDLLVVNWPHLAGERAAAHSVPTKLSRGILTVAAESPAWAAELSVETERLLRRSTAIVGAGTVKKIKVRSRARGAEAPGETVARAGIVVEAECELQGRIAEDIGALEDDEMKLALAKLVQAIRPARQTKHNDQ
jgi:hypothetical protein